jgi:hypothetical protein
MKPGKLLGIAAVASLIAFPAVAQTQTKSDDEQNGHHYSANPKTEAPHRMGKKDTGQETTGKKRGRAAATTILVVRARAFPITPAPSELPGGWILRQSDLAG